MMFEIRDVAEQTHGANCRRYMYGLLPTSLGHGDGRLEAHLSAGGGRNV
jgi:hypothetical protein